MVASEFNKENSFESGSFKSRAILGVPTIPAMARWMVKVGIVKEEKTAGYVLVAVALISVTAALVILYFSYGQAS